MMGDMSMSDEDRAELRRLQSDVESARAAWKDALRRRNDFMHDRFNAYKAEIPELLSAAKLGKSRQMIYDIVDGPRLAERRPRGYRPQSRASRKRTQG